MISFGMTEEQEVVREAMHDFAEQALRPLARECDEQSKVDDDLLQQVWELGLTTTQVPEEFGGGGEARSPITSAIALEELAWGDPGLAVATLAPSMFVNALVDHGSEAQKKSLLPALCGDRFALGSLAVIEPGPFTDASLPTTKAEPKGDGFVISGHKRNVPFGDRATHFLVIARNNGGIDAFIVPRDSEGLAIAEEPEKNLGLRAVPMHALDFERVEVGAEAKLGGAEGCDVRRLLDTSRVAIAACMTGLGRAVVDYCVPYAKDRVAFDEPIARKQAIAFGLAEAHTEVEATRWLTWKAASDLEYGRDATKSAYQAHSYAAEKILWVADNGIQVLGGHGFIREHPVELWFRQAQTLSVLEGTLSI